MYEDRNIKNRFKRDILLALITFPIQGIIVLVKEWELVLFLA